MTEADYTLAIRNGTIVGPSGAVRADVGIIGEQIVTVGALHGRAAHDIDATGRYVLPGGIDPHAHIEQVSANGFLNADDFASATTAAAFGGTTSVIPFAAKHVGLRLKTVVEDYHLLARKGALIDYAFHMILAEADAATLEDLPPLVTGGHTSIKIFMTYDRLKLDDDAILELLATARRLGAFVCVHAENHAMIGFMTRQLVARGLTTPSSFCASHPRLAEVDAIGRMAAFAEFLDQPIMVFHVSTAQGAAAVAAARARGVPLYAETCPQYLFLTEADVDRPGVEGAKWMCSPPLRTGADGEALWAALGRGDLQIVSSDHAPYRFDASGKLAAGATPTFKQIANGMPGLETRLPLLFDAMVTRGRLGVERFVEVTSAAPARLYGLAPRKGTIAPGADADIAVWDPDKSVTLTADLMHDRAGYTPYEGRTVTGWPETVISRGEIVVHEGMLRAAPGRGRFLPRVPVVRPALEWLA